MKFLKNKKQKLIVGEKYIVKKILGEDAFKKRLNSFGIIENSIIKIYKKAPLGDPIIIQINNSNIALREKLFENIILKKITKE